MTIRESFISVLIVIITAGGLFWPWFSTLETPAQSMLHAQKEIAAPEGKQPESKESKISVIEGNTVLASARPSSPDKEETKKIRMVITAYSSSPQETDHNPFITAAGTSVRKGVVANNLLSFGTKIRIPELYGDEVFVVEDRMHRRNGLYHLDIWFHSREQALKFGKKKTYIEILES